jgi:hypothetical protein
MITARKRHPAPPRRPAPKRKPSKDAHRALLRAAAARKAARAAAEGRNDPASR